MLLMLTWSYYDVYSKVESTFFCISGPKRIFKSVVIKSKWSLEPGQPKFWLVPQLLWGRRDALEKIIAFLRYYYTALQSTAGPDSKESSWFCPHYVPTQWLSLRVSSLLCIPSGSAITKSNQQGTKVFGTNNASAKHVHSLPFKALSKQ